MLFHREQNANPLQSFMMLEVVRQNNIRLFWESYHTNKYIPWTTQEFMDVDMCGTVSHSKAALQDMMKC
jgi:hypothetical protein